MTKVKRRIFFYILTIIFVVVSPLIIGYALGFKFNFLQKTIEPTGAVFIKSKIPRLAVFLNNLPVEETSFITGGALITELDPGTYLLRIEKSGFSPVSKTVKVEPMLVTELRDILLVPNPVTYATATAQEIKLIFENEFLDKKNTTEPKIQQSGQIQPQEFSINKKGELLQKGATTTKTLASNVRAFFNTEDGTLLFIDKNGFISRFDLNSGTVEIIGRPGLFLNAGEFRFIKSLNGNIMVLDPSSGLFWIDREKSLHALEGGVKNIKFDETGKKALLLKDNELMVLWLEENSYQPFQKKGDRELIFKSGENIEEAEWFYGDNAHIIMKTRDGIYLTEVDGRGGRTTTELVEGRTDELFVTPEIPNAIFFKKGKTWYKIEL